METFFLELVKLSLIGSLFAAAVILVRLVFPKTPKWILCLMWGVVALRLICPVSIESGFSLVPEKIASGQIITSVADEYIGDVDIIYESNAEYSNAVEAGRQPISSDDGYYVVTEKDSLEAPKTVGETLYPILSGIWAAGMVLMLVYTVVSYLMLRRKMAEATLLRKNIWQCEQVDSPFVLGFFKPKIYLPYTITDSDMVNVIAHEQAHIHRKDHWWKPIGFILLSVHWFNPILWVAYIMLCRDIEAACDERVIKHMEKDEMRAYSTALLNCSVNRRRIAACPLAFGEVGVKERVKTVMNYKKPAFWIVIAAVALCIVVAVCFLTDPKDYGPEVGNPQMLEFPGVEWFVTPEEFKEALNITEDQIVSEGITLEREDVGNDYDRYDLYVTDLTLYGRDVTYALFEFRRDPGYDFAFNQAIVMFAEDTDMVKFRDDLEEIYGAGSQEPYRFYLYYNNEKQYHKTELRLEQDLKYLSQNDRFLEGLDGNPYQDALNDPDYMIHHWATENGCSVIPAEVVEWFKDAMDQPWNADNSVLQDDEVLMEMLDQMPWVSMTISNRCMPPIRRDAEGIEDESAALYTNNYIEFNANFLASYLYEARKEAVDDPGMLELPGVKWGMTPEEVKSALNITEEQIIDELTTSGYILHMYVKDLTLYGKEVSLAQFDFWFNNSGNTALRNALIFFSEDTDMKKLEQELVAIYGPGQSESYVHSLYDNSIDLVKRFDHGVFGLETSAKNEDGYNALEGNPFRDALEDPDYMIHHWVTENGLSLIPEEVVEYFKSGEVEDVPQDEDELMKTLDRMPWVVMTMSNRNATAIFHDVMGAENELEQLYTNNYIQFNARLLAECLYTAKENQATDPTDDTSAASEPTEDTTLSADPPVNSATLADIMASVPALDDGSMLCFPGTRWGSTPEEVKAVLNVAEEQIITDQPNGDSYILLVEDVPFFGSEVVSAEFKFIARNNEFGLATVNLYYPDGTDMSTVEAALLDLYGTPNEGQGFTRYKVSNGAVESYRAWGFTSNFSGKGPFVMNWWESTAKRANLLPAEVQEAMIESGYLTYYMERLDPADPSTRDLILEYLNNDPAVLLYCTNGSNAGNVGFQYYTKNEVSFSALDYMIQLLYNSK